ncbi:MAG: hypothetical protein Q4G69_06190 [Planctomycetia bacterium]|nr:hypothetical protein [Planctomycetia bacterium]
MDKLTIEKSKNPDSSSLSSRKKTERERSFPRFLSLLFLFAVVFCFFGCASDLKTDFQKYVPPLKSARKEEGKKKDPASSDKKEDIKKKKADSKDSKDSKNPFTSVFALKKSSDSVPEEPKLEKRKGSIKDPQKKDPAETPEKLLENGNRAYLEGKFYEAAFAYKRWLKLKDEKCPKETVALVYSRLGEIAQQQTRYQIAMDCFESAVKYSDAKEPKYLFQAGKAHFELGNYAKAEGNFTTILAISPDYDKVHYYYGLTLLNLEKFEEARPHLAKDLGEAEAFHLLAEKAYELKKSDLAQELENKMIAAAQQQKIPAPIIKNRPAETVSPIPMVQKNDGNVPQKEAFRIDPPQTAPAASLPVKSEKAKIAHHPSVAKESAEPAPQKIISAAKAPSALPPFPLLSPVFPVKNESAVKTAAAQKPAETALQPSPLNKADEKYENEIPQLPSLPGKKGGESTLVKSLLADTPKKSDPLPVASAPALPPAPELPAPADSKPALEKKENPADGKGSQPAEIKTAKAPLPKQPITDEIIVYAPNELFAIKLIDRNSEEAKKILVQYGVIIPLKQYKTNHLYPARPKIADLMKPEEQPEKIASLPPKSVLIPEKTPAPAPAPTADPAAAPAPANLQKTEDQNEGKRYPVPAPFAEKSIPIAPAPLAKESPKQLFLPGPVNTGTNENPAAVFPAPFPVVNMNFPQNDNTPKLPHAIDTSVPVNPVAARIQKEPVILPPQKEEVQLPDLDPSEIKDSVRIAELEKPKKDPSAFDENSDFGFAESRQYTLTTLPESYAKELGKSHSEENTAELKKQIVDSAPQTIPAPEKNLNLLPDPVPAREQAQLAQKEAPAAQIKDLAQMENRILLTPADSSNVKQVAAVQPDPAGSVVPIPAKTADQNEKKGSFWSNPFKSIRIPTFWSEQKK